MSTVSPQGISRNSESINLSRDNPSRGIGRSRCRSCDKDKSAHLGQEDQATTTTATQAHLEIGTRLENRICVYIYRERERERDPHA